MCCHRRRQGNGYVKSDSFVLFKKSGFDAPTFSAVSNRPLSFIALSYCCRAMQCFSTILLIGASKSL